MTARLDSYRKKRDFQRTPEPGGEQGASSRSGGRFVVQEHHARALHWDFRLEHDGVLVSWAIPRGVPADPHSDHLAVHTEDHPLEYLDFEGNIPEGNYGAGRVLIWDRGTYVAEKFRDDEVIVRLSGKRLQGRYALFQTGDKQWMIHRMDPPQDPRREAMPNQIAPMLPTLVTEVPPGDRWAFEVKWDGVRAIAYIQGGRVRLQSRNMLDITRHYPELAELGAALGSQEVVLDGEVVAFDDHGRPSFERLQQRMGQTNAAIIRRRRNEVPVVYVAFDLLYLDGHVILSLPYVERRSLLTKLLPAGSCFRVPDYHAGDGESMLAASRRQGLEGLVAKRLDSVYEPGKRTHTWLKVKNALRQEFVVGGYTRGEGNRAATLGALLIGYYEGGRLRYGGKVGTGLTMDTMAKLMPLLTGAERPGSPFVDGRPPLGSRFVEPRIVVEVAFTEWTAAGMVRHPSFKGLRIDKDPREVVREVAAERS